jgi:hypothetical protein
MLGSIRSVERCRSRHAGRQRTEAVEARKLEPRRFADRVSKEVSPIPCLVVKVIGFIAASIASAGAGGALAKAFVDLGVLSQYPGSPLPTWVWGVVLVSGLCGGLVGAMAAAATVGCYEHD